MPRSDPFTDALRDLAEDIAYHTGNLLRRAFDLTCLLALGLLVYATSFDPANAGLHGRPLFGVQAAVVGSLGVAVNASHAPTACALTNDLLAAPHRNCTNALVLQPAEI